MEKTWMRSSIIARRLRFAMARPDLVWRRVKGNASTEIHANELVAYLPDVTCVVEAGALNGRDTIELSTSFPHSTIHAFEPVPAAYGVVVETVRTTQNVKTYQLALAEQSGVQKMFVSSNELGSHRPDSSSLLRPTGHLQEMPTVKFNEEETVATITLDDWMKSIGIKSIDLLWLDLQGMELAVLRASPEAVSTVRGIMMEISREELYAGSPLYGEVIQWMADEGFAPVIDRVSRVFGNAFFIRRGKPD